MKLFYTILVACALSATSCTNQAKFNESDFIGSWVQPIPGITGEQGFLLEEGGKAESVNMATLQYDSWNLQGNQLILSGKSLGNGTTIAFQDTLTVLRLTNDSLVVSQNRGKHAELHYTRMNTK